MDDVLLRIQQTNDVTHCGLEAFCKMMPWPPFSKCDVIYKMRLHQLMCIHLWKNSAKFYPNWI